MKALSFHQPRAEQVVRGEKTLDVRTWQVSFRGVLAIHASSKRRDARCRALGFEPENLDYGALIGTLEVTGIVPLDEETYEALRDQHLLDTPFPGAPCYGWQLASPCRFEAAIPYRGRMRLFNVSLPAEADREAQDHAPQGREPCAPATIYRASAPPEPDPEHPFVLYAIPEKDGGYRVALYQWGQRNSEEKVRAPGAYWGMELGGDPLRAVADHLLAALRANDYKATDLARAVGAEKPFYLDELTGLRLALILIAVRPLTRHDRMEAIGQEIHAMSAEEAYYWFSKCSAGTHAPRAQRALRILLAEE